MGMRTCACRKWEMSGLPCCHALRVIAKKNLNHDDYTSQWYSNAKQRNIYSENIDAVNGLRFWKKSGDVIKAPPNMIEEIQNMRGKKGKHESPIKKASRQKRVMHCGRCGQAGHNVTKCNNIGVKISRQKKKSGQIEDGYESGGPSQPTQD